MKENVVYVEVRDYRYPQKECDFKNCRQRATRDVIRTEGKEKCIVSTCELHMLETYRVACEYMFKIKK
ncbi:MAG: hypothetical protein IMZ58_07340 [Thermoplasmata archaeon]|nr:hypothetical protein [Thermoplasmata archaeon]